MTLVRRLYQIEFVQSKIDPCVFWLIPQTHGGEILGVLPIHVDDARGGVDARLQNDIRGRLESVVSLGAFQELFRNSPGSIVEVLLIGSTCIAIDGLCGET